MTRFTRNARPWETMTALDATICMENAQTADPRRGADYLEAFRRKAVELGYLDVPDSPCECVHAGGLHDPQCHLVRPAEPVGRVWPYEPSFAGLLQRR